MNKFQEIGQTISHMLGEDAPFILLYQAENRKTQVISNVEPEHAGRLLELHLDQMRGLTTDDVHVFTTPDPS